MKKRIAMIGLITVAAISMTILGYWILTAIPSSSYPLEDAQMHYQHAVSKLENTKNLQFQLTITTTRKIGNETYTEESRKTIHFQGLHQSDFAATVEETLHVGTHTTEVTEQYHNGTLYITIHGSQFSAECTANEFLQQHPFAALLDNSIYQSISGEVSQGTSVLTLSQPRSAEAWAMPDHGEFIRAEGKAWLTSADDLTRSQYTISYRTTDAVITVQYDVQITSLNPSAISPPASTADYTPINNPYTLKSLEIASGHLTQADTATAQLHEQLLCQAFGDIRDREVILNIHSGDNWSARLDTIITDTNDSQENTVAIYTQSEIYRDGLHTIHVNDDPPTEDATIAEDALRNYCQELLLGTIILPKYITGISYSEQNHIQHIEFSGSEEFAKSISQYICQTLYQDSAVLDSMAESYTTSNIQCYLDISTRTGLPVASGVKFSGSHGIHGLEYQISYCADQSYTLPSNGALNAIQAS